MELGTRNLKIALRRLREFARDGAEEVLGLDATIAATAGKAGMLDLRMQRELRNAVKVLVLFDVGGSMDDHVKACEELFSAVKSEFKHLGISTSTTASTKRCGRTMPAAIPAPCPPGT